MRRYLFNLLRLLSIAFNVVFCFDRTIQTFSRRVGLAKRRGERWAVIVAALLNPVFRRLTGQPDHFEEAADMEGCIH